MMITIEDTLRKEEAHHIKRNFHHQGNNHHMICHMISSVTSFLIPFTINTSRSRRRKKDESDEEKWVEKEEGPPEPKKKKEEIDPILTKTGNSLYELMEFQMCI